MITQPKIAYADVVVSETINDKISRYAKQYGDDGKVLGSIAQCESNMTQFKADGSILRGLVNQSDVGVMQINEAYHLKSSQRLGMDIYTLDGNIQYGAWLLKHQGTQPWDASKNCWIKLI